jgi:hypothetical protein
VETDFEAEALKIKTLYEDDPRDNTFNFLIYGGVGSGKTSLVRTCPTPILVHSFDPNGSEVLRGRFKGCPYKGNVESGDIFVDRSFEIDHTKKPEAFENWKKEFDRLVDLDFFSKIGTFVIDSGTTFSSAALSCTMAKAGRAGGVPRQDDWHPQMILLEHAIKRIINQPCNTVFICHDQVIKDEITGKLSISVLLTGKLVTRIPLLFDEIYYAKTAETSRGIEYKLQTQKTTTIMARSRLGKGGELDIYENADIKNILKKVGIVDMDKERLFTNQKTGE